MGFTAVIQKESKGYVAKALEIEIASQGKTIDGAIANLKEALGLYLKHADAKEIKALQKKQFRLLIAPIEVLV
ncbi:MAG: type II toxin-antitoxin system HicB family antitoxin [Candidatus Micrarchaeota archaeon]